MAYCERAAEVRTSDWLKRTVPSYDDVVVAGTLFHGYMSATSVL